MSKTTLEQWRMFKAVVDAGGFNQAAERVHKSQSSIHHAVQKLEQLLGVKLLQAKGRKMQLTSEGEALLRRADYLLDEVERVEQVAATLGSGVESRLDLAVDQAFPQELLNCVLERLAEDYPQLHIALYETVLTGANELVEEGQVLLALSPFPSPGGLNEEICHAVFMPVAAPSHPLHQLGRELTYEELKTHRQIVTRDSGVHSTRDVGWQGSEQRWTVTHLRSSIDLVRRGSGFAWLPEHALHDLLATGQLQRLPLPATLDRQSSFYLNYADRDQLGPAARSFMGLLRLEAMSNEGSEPT